MPRLINLKTAERPDIVTPSSIAKLIEENEILYIDQVHELGKQYGGKLVTNKKLCNGLMRNLKVYLLSHGEPPDALSPSNYPMEKFIPVALSFRIPALGMDVDRWFFFRVPKVFVLDPRVKKL